MYFVHKYLNKPKNIKIIYLCKNMFYGFSFKLINYCFSALIKLIKILLRAFI